EGVEAGAHELEAEIEGKDAGHGKEGAHGYSYTDDSQQYADDRQEGEADRQAKKEIAGGDLSRHADEEEHRLAALAEDRQEGEESKAEEAAGGEGGSGALTDVALPGAEAGLAVEPVGHIQEHRGGDEAGRALEQLTMLAIEGL